LAEEVSISKKAIEKQLDLMLDEITAKAEHLPNTHPIIKSIKALIINNAEKLRKIT
jgi:hypothetical protein